MSDVLSDLRDAALDAERGGHLGPDDRPARCELSPPAGPPEGARTCPRCREPIVLGQAFTAGRSGDEHADCQHAEHTQPGLSRGCRATVTACVLLDTGLLAIGWWLAT